MDFKSLSNIALKYGERNDCAVKATAVVLGTSYEDAHTLLATFGRENGKGTCFFSNLVPAFAYRGFKLNYVKPKHKTIIDFENRKGHENHNYPLLIRTSGHILGVNKNGEVCDYTSGKRHKIKEIYEIIPIDDNPIYKKEVGEFVEPLKIKNDFKYALINKETKEVYKKYKRFPNKIANNIVNIYITNKMSETKGKLELINL